MIRKAALIIIGALLLLSSCSQRAKTSIARSGNVVYYWRTTFSLDSLQLYFLRHHHISSIYCRYFDVVKDAKEEVVPNATIQFRQAIPDGIEIVPTVFIMNNCMQQFPDSLAQRIVRRIVQMNETHDVTNVHEIQIDCDYTARNRKLYYQFLQEVRDAAAAHGLRLSTTIRLHQLSMPAPPADYGVLMLYNTGEPNRFIKGRNADGSWQRHNPILDLRDVQPYVRYLKDYPLPLAAAYPVFRWQRTLHGVQVEHVAKYDDIIRTKQLVEAERADLSQLIFTYHLDNENILRYTTEQYENIYHH
jgi:hypothetical protein